MDRYQVAVAGKKPRSILEEHILKSHFRIIALQIAVHHLGHGPAVLQAHHQVPARHRLHLVAIIAVIKGSLQTVVEVYPQEVVIF